MNKKSFFIRILLPTILTIILFVTVFFVLIVPQFETTIMDRKREMIKELTNSAASILEKWYSAEQEGEVSRGEAQEIAAAEIESLRYGDEGKDYFWITDYTPVMIMHPYRPDLNNQNLSDIKDSHGKKLFVEMADTAKEMGEGFVDYMWQWKDDSTKIVPKLSYVKAFQPWKWVIGTGIYLEDVRQEISSLEQKIIDVSLVITGVIAVLLSFIAYQNLRTEKQRRHAESELHKSRERYRTLVEASTEGLIMIIEGGQIFFNRMLYMMLGYKENSDQVQLDKMFADPPDLKSYDFEEQKITDLEKALPDQSEALMQKSDGTVLRVLINASRISLYNQRGIVLSVKDLSRAEKNKDDRDDTGSEFAQFADQLSTGLFKANIKKDFQLTELNNAARQIWNIDREDAPEKVLLQQCFADRTEFESFKRDVLDQGIVRHRISTVRGSGRMMDISALLSGRDSGTEIIEGIVEDVTSQYQTSEAREELIKELQTAFLFLDKPAGPLIQPLPECPPDLPVIDAINLITREKSDCLLIIDKQGKKLGFFSESDIRKRILTHRENLDEPVYKFMSAPLVTISSDANNFHVMEKFYEHNIRHLLMQDDQKKITGVLNAEDLQKFTHASYLFFIRKIKEASSTGELVNYYTHLKLLVKGLIKRNTGAAGILRLLSGIADPIIKRVIELTVERLGKPPVDFAFIILGSAGRSEQTLATDQDNAVIYEDCEGETAEAAKEYFLKLGEIAAADLNKIGFHYCKGEIMASNPKWCQPYSQWKRYFTEWVNAAEPRDLLDIKIFFDYSTAYGSPLFLEQLQAHITRITSSYNPFFVYFAENIIRYQIPEEAFKLKTPFDIKKVMLPLVDALRLYGLKKKISNTHSLERLERIYSADIFSDSMYKNTLQTYDFLMSKRLEHQAEMLSRNKEPDNLISPEELSELETALLKKSLSVIQDIQAKLNIDFKGTVSV